MGCATEQPGQGVQFTGVDPQPAGHALLKNFLDALSGALRRCRASAHGRRRQHRAPRRNPPERSPPKTRPITASKPSRHHRTPRIFEDEMLDIMRQVMRGEVSRR